MGIKSCEHFILQTNIGLGLEDCQHTVIDAFLCMVATCTLGTDVCQRMFRQKSIVQYGSRSTRFPFKRVCTETERRRERERERERERT